MDIKNLYLRQLCTAATKLHNAEFYQCAKFHDNMTTLSDVTTTQKQQPSYGPLSGTTQVSWYQKKHSPTHHPDHHPIFISFFHLPRSIATSFKLRAWKSFCTTSFHVLFGLPLGLEPSTSYSICLEILRHVISKVHCPHGLPTGTNINLQLTRMESENNSPSPPQDFFFLPHTSMTFGQFHEISLTDVKFQFSKYMVTL